MFNLKLIITPILSLYLGLFIVEYYQSFRLIDTTPFSLVCHQNTDRCPELFNQSFPLCWRCCGLHLGFFLSVAGMAKLKRKQLFKILIPSLVISVITISLWKYEIDIPSFTRLVSGLSIAFTACISLKFAYLFLVVDYSKKLTEKGV